MEEVAAQVTYQSFTHPSARPPPTAPRPKTIELTLKHALIGLGLFVLFVLAATVGALTTLWLRG